LSRAHSFDPWHLAHDYVVALGYACCPQYPEGFDFQNTPHPFDRAGETSAYGDHEPWDSCYGCGQREFALIHNEPEWCLHCGSYTCEHADRHNAAYGGHA
jgi:hypothetical protein